jgi:tRNA-binding EMAP/Myf-like protein
MIPTTINWDDFARVDLRAATIVRAEAFPEAKKPSIKLWLDVGELGIKRSSAQITVHYRPEDLIGKQYYAFPIFPASNSEFYFRGTGDRLSGCRKQCGVDHH